MLGKQPIVPIEVGYYTYSWHSYFNLSTPGSYPYIPLQTVHSFTEFLSSYFLTPFGRQSMSHIMNSHGVVCIFWSELLRSP